MTTENRQQKNAVIDQVPVSGDPRWYVLYTRSRHEKYVETHLLQKGLEAFTPKVTLKKKWSDRTRLVEEPIFKSYCFAKFSLSDKLKIVTQRGVVNIVHVNGQYLPIEDSVINALKILVESKLKIDPCPYLKEGDRIVIRKGPLKGLEGYIVEKRNRNSVLVVSVDAIASSIRCFVDIDCVEQA
ncbi:MAG TPA: UpxY family transcription antiterminator [Nitrospirae bacterium]|nr:transcription antitermination protein RfaH [bacterium BMS3Abin10]GBE39573.1 transcription antitermination protein RfaH [bacterium BMS3Bbin08]HDH50217.1 UpxY family transcription antiterminator [Nitrospirota bacterium]HDK16758.1 UpxY family transcription antiterminator [Nitrospirota bacterium]HDK41145.1 UpxY family transcription antiterminator [Nitrospirota bacterium]